MHPRPRESQLRLKKNRILTHIFQEGEASRFALAHRLTINASMVGKYVDDFLKEGVLVEDARRGSRRGRIPVAVRLNPAHGCFLGVDFEALRVRAVLTDFAGRTIIRRETPFRAGTGREQILGAVLATAKSLARQSGRRPLLAVGVAAPGLVDIHSGRVLRYPLVRDFNDVPVREMFEKRFDAPVFVEHNIHTLTLAEMVRGGGRGHSDVLCLVVRSGVGLGIVIGGRIHRGVAEQAGRVGFTSFPHAGGPKNLVDLVSATGIAQRARDLLRTLRKTPERQALLSNGDGATLEDIVRAADAGDGALRALLEETGRTLGLLLANLANLFAPEKIILVGEVPACSPILRHGMEHEYRRFLLPELEKGIAIADSGLEGFGSAMGAACLGFLRRYPVEGPERPAEGR
jgi:predicted NBD/HSP70 family sugar kinase